MVHVGMAPQSAGYLYRFSIGHRASSVRLMLLMGRMPTFTAETMIMLILRAEAPYSRLTPKMS